VRSGRTDFPLKWEHIPAQEDFATGLHRQARSSIPAVGGPKTNVCAGLSMLADHEKPSFGISD